MTDGMIIVVRDYRPLPGGKTSPMGSASECRTHFGGGILFKISVEESVDSFCRQKAYSTWPLP